MQKIAESVFDILYLVSIITIGGWMIAKAGSRKDFRTFGLMALLLGCGDAFHLVPRVLNYWMAADMTAAMGIGKLVTSVTMTVFYVLLFRFWTMRYPEREKPWMLKAVLILAAVRIILCLFPQNDWLTAEGSFAWGIYRNIPFTVLGVMLMAVWYAVRDDRCFRFMWLALLLSFFFYWLVVLFSRQIPAMGAMMMPKTCAYVWSVLMGVKAFREETEN